jgi:ankyrin repeat protein
LGFGHTCALTATAKMAAAPAATPALWLAVLRGDTELARQLLWGGANIDEKDFGSNPWTPLQLAVSRVVETSSWQGNQVELVQLLLEHKASVHVRNNKGETPLHLAAQFGYAEAVLGLLQHGADVKTRNDYGETPLGSAVAKGNGAVAVVRHLLQYQSDVTAVDARSMMPLHWAALLGHAAVVLLLLDSGANVLAGNSLGSTAERLAEHESHHEVVAILKAEAVTRAKCVAFAMGNQERLGVGSRVLWLDPGVVKMVIALV